MPFAETYWRDANKYKMLLKWEVMPILSCFQFLSDENMLKFGNQGPYNYQKALHTEKHL